jgi:hypothetical protein
MDEKANALREEIRLLRQQAEELNGASSAMNTEVQFFVSIYQNVNYLLQFGLQEDAQENAKYELLVKRDQEMTAFVDKFDEVPY